LCKTNWKELIAVWIVKGSKSDLLMSENSQVLHSFSDKLLLPGPLIDQELEENGDELKPFSTHSLLEASRGGQSSHANLQRTRSAEFH